MTPVHVVKSLVNEVKAFQSPMMFGAVAEEWNVGIVHTKFPDDKNTTIVSQIASALIYLHTQEPKIARCDIKTAGQRQ